MTQPTPGCDLCALPVGRGPLEKEFDGQRKLFCCAGCLNVYAILLESGVIAEGGDFRQSEVFQQSLKLGLISNPESRQTAIPEGAETREMLYHVSGMWCTSCGWLVEHALRREYGIVSAEVLFTSDLLKVTYCPQYLSPDRVPSRVSSLGYKAEEFSGERDFGRDERFDLLLKLGIAGALWMNVMLFSLVIYASYFEGISEWARRAIPWVLMALSTPVVFWSAWPIHRLAVLGLRQGTIRMEALISSGVLAAYFYSVVQGAQGSKYLYFDTACAIVTLVLTGKALERGAKEKTSRAIAMLYRLMPKKARWTHEGHEKFVSIEAVEPGMTLLVKPGERIPTDGIVLEGSSPVDESVVTGESAPRAKAAGDEVVGGSLNGAGVLQIRAQRAPAQSTLAQIIRSVEQALATRTPLERAVDRASRVFVPAVMIIAVLTVAGCLLYGLDSGTSLLRGIAVLVIACPCALGIATPLATTAAVGGASRHGILIRDARVLETIRKVDVLVLDKTGTATEGRFLVRDQSAALRSVTEPRPLGSGPLILTTELQLVASLEAQSEHPLADAIVRHAREQGLELLPATNVDVRPGLGISGDVAGHRLAVGREAMLGIPAPAPPAGWIEEGLTVVHCAIDGAYSGSLALGDRVRPDAALLVRQLAARGVRTLLLSGDSAATTACIARQIGAAEYRGEVRPEQKAETIKQLQEQGAVVAMAGDGINDAPALAAADLGLAMGSGADLAMQAAPVVLMTGSLLRIVETFDLARFTLRVVKQNLFWAFFYNVIGISLSITGVLNPILAAAAMVLSSLSVIGNSLRLYARTR